MTAWASSEPTQHLTRYSDNKIKLEKVGFRVIWQR